MSQAWYGSYAHDTNSVGFNSYQREYVQGPTGRNKTLKITIDLEAKIIRPTVVEIQNELATMRAAYSVPGQSFAFYDDNNNLTNWSLPSSLCVGGVVVTAPVSHGDIKGAHGVNFLKCSIKLQGEILQPLNAFEFLSFSETLSFTGTGRPLKVWRQPTTGLPFAQQTAQNTPFTCVQSGSLTTTTAWPSPPDPIWPDLLEGTPDDTQITPSSPATIRGAPVEYGISWSYRFKSASPFVGSPNAYG